MCSKILKSNGQILHTSTCCALKEEEWRNPEEIKAQQLFDGIIGKRLGQPATEDKIKKIDPDAITRAHEPIDPDFKRLDVNDASPECHDQCIGAEVALPFQGTMATGKVKCRSHTEAGELCGKVHENPTLGTRSHKVEFPNGTVNLHTANIIVMNVLAQCNKEGNHLAMLDEIVGLETDGTEVPHEDWHVHKGNNRHLCKMTKGWKLAVKWKDASTSWE